MTEVGIKNDIGSLYDAESKQAFDAAATEGPDGTRSAPWLAIEAYAKKRDDVNCKYRLRCRTPES